ncbi:MAG: hypothetical protein WCJ35_15550 [Planctomycetota bacterium]
MSPWLLDMLKGHGCREAVVIQPWQGRFASLVMDEPHLLAAARYVELNPVRAKLANHAGERPRSSARAHLSGHDDRLGKVAPLGSMIDDWEGFLNRALREEELGKLRDHGRTSWPHGDETFLVRLEPLVGCPVKPQKPGRKPILREQPN